MKTFERFEVLCDKLSLQRCKMQMDRFTYDMLNDLDKYKSISKQENKYLLLGTSWVREKLLDPNISKEGRKYLFNLYKEWDDYGNISLELGTYIETLVNDDTISLGIHRTNIINNSSNEDLVNNTLLCDIFNNGLKSDGDLANDAISKGVIHPSKTISFFSSMLDAIIHIKTSYKGSDGGILVLFPSNLVLKDGTLVADKVKDVYDVINNICYIKAEYLAGYIYQDDGVCIYYQKNKFVNDNSL